MIKHFLKIKKLLNGSVNRPQTKKRTTTVENTEVFKDFLILARSEMDKTTFLIGILSLILQKLELAPVILMKKKYHFQEIL